MIAQLFNGRFAAFVWSLAGLVTSIAILLAVVIVAWWAWNRGLKDWLVGLLGRFKK